MPNIKLSYLYRDAGNYKNFGSVVFTNKQVIPLEKIQETIKASLIEGHHFVANKWNVPDLHSKHFDWNDELDHGWHEYENVGETEEPSTNNEDIAIFLENIQQVYIPTHILK